MIDRTRLSPIELQLIRKILSFLKEINEPFQIHLESWQFKSDLNAWLVTYKIWKTYTDDGGYHLSDEYQALIPILAVQSDQTAEKYAKWQTACININTLPAKIEEATLKLEVTKKQISAINVSSLKHDLSAIAMDLGQNLKSLQSRLDNLVKQQQENIKKRDLNADWSLIIDPKQRRINMKSENLLECEKHD